MSTEQLLEEIAEIEALLAEWQGEGEHPLLDPDVEFVVTLLTRCLEKRRRLVSGRLH